jgi:hypothetical protein
MRARRQSKFGRGGLQEIWNRQLHFTRLKEPSTRLGMTAKYFRFLVRYVPSDPGKINDRMFHEHSSFAIMSEILGVSSLMSVSVFHYRSLELRDRIALESARKKRIGKV